MPLTPLIRLAVVDLPRPSPRCSNILEHLDQHDHIVRYIERFVDKQNTMLYIIMEYCQGGDLTGLIRQYRKAG